ncbi:hypothetical protein BY996DRAFT_4572751 [Phakopsora pachyrhizi]|nr:hypothetical protein BY996DRAFT_4572751 [Phakopsora pachyrhizi]
MDDILDLSFSNLPPASQNGKTPSTVASSQKKGYSSFDYLSASIARPSYNNQRSNSSIPSIQPSNRQASNTRSSTNQQSTSTSSNDAFSSLFSDGQSNSNGARSNPATMTMAERLKAAEGEKSQTFFGGLGSGTTISPSPSPGYLSPNPASTTGVGSPLGNNKSSQIKTYGNMNQLTSSEPWDFDLLNVSNKSPIPKVNSPGFVSMSPNTSKAKNNPLVNDDWKVDQLDSLNEIDSGGLIDSNPEIFVQNQFLTNQSQSSSSLLGDEFGPLERSRADHRGTTSLVDEPDSDRDILGLLGNPISLEQVERNKHKASEVSQRSDTPQTNRTPTGSSKSLGLNGSADSPPPHILGKIVEMGFSLAESRQALFQTREPATGNWNVSAAVSNLVGDQIEVEAPSNRNLSSSPLHEISSHPPNHRSSNTADRNKPPTTLTNVSGKEIQDQATELLAQASAYGSTALGKAASFWKQSKASLTKVIEDQTGSSGPGPSIKDGEAFRPKWMRGAPASPIEEHGLPPHPSDKALFSDFDNHPGTNGRIRSEAAENSPVTKAPEARKPYVSSARRLVSERSDRKTLPSNSDNQLKSRPIDELDIFSQESSQTSQLKTSGTSSRPPPSFPKYEVVGASQQQISRSTEFKTKGNGFFKQGQYASAESAYSQALGCFPDSSIQSSAEKFYFGCIPLYNNRATARLKNGDARGARDDVNKVVDVLFGEESELNQSAEYLNKRLEWNQSRVPEELRGSIDVAEQLGKALSKRAKIKEDSEKWNEARIDWESCRNLGGGVMRGAGGIKIVADGMSRCQRAVNSGEGGSSRPQKTHNTDPNINRSKVLPQKPPTLTGHQPVHQPPKGAIVAVEKLRKANEQAETEANLKLESKDRVDEMILNWKGGKENNLRALLASLDQVLWESLGWKKVGMGELLTEGQVKSKYVRAISKVHPDKIPKDATVVEQMIAKSVFSVLNEACISMQP